MATTNAVKTYGTFIVERDCLLYYVFEDKRTKPLFSDLCLDTLMKDFTCNFEKFEKEHRLDSILNELSDTGKITKDNVVDVTYCLYDINYNISNFIRSLIKDEECSFWIEEFTHDKDPIVVAPYYKTPFKYHRVRHIHEKGC